MSKRFPGKYPRSPRDFYPTPAEAVLPLVPHLRAAGVQRFCEPCCGDGALVRHLTSHGRTCADAGDISAGQNALDIPNFDFDDHHQPAVLVGAAAATARSFH